MTEAQALELQPYEITLDDHTYVACGEITVGQISRTLRFLLNVPGVEDAKDVATLIRIASERNVLESLVAITLRPIDKRRDNADYPTAEDVDRVRQMPAKDIRKLVTVFFYANTWLLRDIRDYLARNKVLLNSALQFMSALLAIGELQPESTESSDLRPSTTQ